MTTEDPRILNFAEYALRHLRVVVRIASKSKGQKAN
jgi:hypothetical protein